MKNELKEKARALRRQGWSFRQISEKLKVSKSTTSFWSREEKMTKIGMRRFNNLIVVSRIKAQQVLLKKKEKYQKELEENCLVLKGKKYSRNDLKIFLALLYWCEGSKTKKDLSFINSDPHMVGIYVKLLKRAFLIDSSRLRAVLHLHDYHNKEEMLNFWSDISGIDKKRISIYNKHNSGVNLRAGYKGCISVRYGDYKIFDELKLIAERFAELKI